MLTKLKKKHIVFTFLKPMDTFFNEFHRDKYSTIFKKHEIESKWRNSSKTVYWYTFFSNITDLDIKNYPDLN